MEIEYIIILLSNVLVAVGFFLATLYRIKIEKNQVEIIIENAKAAEKIKKLRLALEKEKDLISEMTKEELFDLLKKLTEEKWEA